MSYVLSRLRWCMFFFATEARAATGDLDWSPWRDKALQADIRGVVNAGTPSGSVDALIALSKTTEDRRLPYLIAGSAEKIGALTPLADTTGRSSDCRSRFREFADGYARLARWQACKALRPLPASFAALDGPARVAALAPVGEESAFPAGVHALRSKMAWSDAVGFDLILRSLRASMAPASARDLDAMATRLASVLVSRREELMSRRAWISLMSSQLGDPAGRHDQLVSAAAAILDYDGSAPACVARLRAAVDQTEDAVVVSSGNKGSGFGSERQVLSAGVPATAAELEICPKTSWSGPTVGDPDLAWAFGWLASRLDGYAEASAEARRYAELLVATP